MIPETLQALKDRDRKVQKDEAQIRKAGDEKWWADLVSIAETNLGPLWECVINKDNRPHHFTRENATDFTFQILLPGRRKIYAIFRGDDATIANGQWRRGYYYGVNCVDAVEKGQGLGHWMVEPRSEKRLMTYHHTLGSAMLAAELI